MNIRSAAFAAGRWTLVSTLLRALFQLAQTMLLARLLDPSDFGLMAIAGGVIAVSSVFANLGMNSALMHFPLPSRAVLSTLYWLNIFVSIVLAAALSLSAVLVSWVYDQPDLMPLLMVASAMFPLSALGQQFIVLCEKQLRFADLSMIESVAALGGFITAILCALSGAGAYTFVAGTLVVAMLSSALSWYWLANDFRPSRHFAWREALPFLRFGAFQLGDTVCNSLRMQIDIFVGAYFAPASAMGFYSITRDLCLRLGGTVVNPAITRVGLPVMAMMQGDRRALKEVYLQTVQLTASLNLPLYALLIVYADETVEVILGEQWIDAGLYMRIFAAWGLLRSIGSPVGSLLYATGAVRLSFWWNVALLLGVPSVLLLSASWFQLPGLAWAMLGIQAFVFVPAWRVLILPVCGAGFLEYCRQLFAPFLATSMAVAFAALIGNWFDGALTRLLVVTLTMAIAYGLASYWVNRRWLVTALELSRPLWKRRQ